MNPIIKISELTKVYRVGENQEAIIALDKVSMEQEEGGFLVIMGPSGCGKTTLLNVVAGFETPDSGQCLVGGKNVMGPGPDRGVVFQEYALFPWMTVERNITFAMQAAGQWYDGGSARALDILDRMGLSEFIHAFPKNLSGGMRQRVAIARLIAINSPVMLMDEPFGALDALTRRNLQRELVALWRETKKTILFITHSADEAIYLADRVLVMTPRPGKVVLSLKVELPRPRDPTSLEFNLLKRKILDVISPNDAAENGSFQVSE